MNFSHITIVNVDGRYGDLLETQYALVKSGIELPGARMLLLSPQRPDVLLDQIEHRTIQAMGYLEYSLFVMYALHHFISTEFALIVQNDGWVLGGENWKDEFTEYDYIGAPIHLARVRRNGEEHYLRGFEWTKYLSDPLTKIDLVMNGGFSLRSKRFLTAPCDLSLSFVLPPVSHLEGPPIKMAWASDSHLEDVHLCIDMRDQLEESGIKYAPLELAKYFAFEHLCPDLHANFDLSKVFGHHSKFRKFGLLDPLTVSFQMQENQLDMIVGERYILELFKSRGYKTVFN